ncbi:MAG TPA: hypothetical protein VKI20_02400 [Acidimicrobiales bacterium]|nr:hypothetical protein [Acidimicrobiales bacterium]
MPVIERGALTTSWTRVIPGREAQALESFAKAMQFNEKLEKQGRIDGSRVFFAVTGKSRGQMVLVGRLEELTRLLTDDEYGERLREGQLVVEDLEVTLWAGGAPDTISGAMTVLTQELHEHGLL